jgi:hypothetical protein
MKKYNIMIWRAGTSVEERYEISASNRAVAATRAIKRFSKEWGKHATFRDVVGRSLTVNIERVENKREEV